MTPTIHRGIVITRAEVPGAPFEWVHDEVDAHGLAPSLEDAKRQINVHLGSPDPDCPHCRGHGADDWAYLAMIDCRCVAGEF